MPFAKRLRLFFFYLCILAALLAGITFSNIFSHQNESFYWMTQPYVSFWFEQLVALPELAVFGISFGLGVVTLLLILLLSSKFTLTGLLIELFLLVISWNVVASEYGILLPLVELLSAILLGILVGIHLKMIFSSVEKDFLRSAFSQYVSKDVLHQLLKDPTKLRLSSEEKDITVMFLDIRGFSTYSEKKSANVVVNRLNELLEIVTRTILEHNGTVDKYIGDAVMAVWNGPISDNRQATHACQAAIKIKQEIESNSDFSVGIGINYGHAIVGNVGSSQRLDYTAIGDTVNLASRLESQTKELKQHIVISKSVLDKAKEEGTQMEVKDLGTIQVKGKLQKTDVFGFEV